MLCQKFYYFSFINPSLVHMNIPIVCTLSIQAKGIQVYWDIATQCKA